MDYLLQYVKTLRITPAKTRITATQKLALYNLILEGEGGSFVINPDRFAEDNLLGHIKSVWRSLKELEDAGLVEITPRRDERGHKLNPLVLPLPFIERRSNEIVTRQNPSNNPVTPSNNPVTLSNNTVTRQNNGKVPEESNLTPPPRGTVIAIPPPPVFNIEGEGERSNENVTTDLAKTPAVKIWLELIREELPASAARLIARKVTNLSAWGDTLDGWLANPKWSKHNVDGQINRYEKKLKDYPEEVIPSPTDSPLKDDNENYRGLIYGD